MKVVKGDAGLARVLNPAGFDIPLDFGHHQFSSTLRCGISYICARPFPPGHPPCPHHVWLQTSKSLPTGYFCTEQRGKLPAWMLLFEPCALKHGLVLWLFLRRSSSRAGFSGATERNAELGPQETRARQSYHNLLERSIFGFWHSSFPDSGTKHPPASKGWIKPSLSWCSLMGCEPTHGLIQQLLTLFFLTQMRLAKWGEPILKTLKRQITLSAALQLCPSLHTPQMVPAPTPKSTSSCPVHCPCFMLGWGPIENVLTSSSWKMPFNQNRSLPRDCLQPEITRNL